MLLRREPRKSFSRERGKRDEVRRATAGKAGRPLATGCPEASCHDPLGPGLEPASWAAMASEAPPSRGVFAQATEQKARPDVTKRRVLTFPMGHRRSVPGRRVRQSVRVRRPGIAPLRGTQTHAGQRGHCWLVTNKPLELLQRSAHSRIPHTLCDEQTLLWDKGHKHPHLTFAADGGSDPGPVPSPASAEGAGAAGLPSSACGHT